MKINKRLYSAALASAAIILFLILVSSTASAVITQCAPPTITEKKIDFKNGTSCLTNTSVISHIGPTSFLVEDSTNNKTLVTAIRPKGSGAKNLALLQNKCEPS